MSLKSFQQDVSSSFAQLRIITSGIPSYGTHWTLLQILHGAVELFADHRFRSTDPSTDNDDDEDNDNSDGCDVIGVGITASSI